MQVAVVMDEDGHIIDGHHRVWAFEELADEGRIAGEYPVDVRRGLTEEQKRDLAWSLNMQRRHLNRGQKQQAIIAKLKESPEWADNRIGKLLGVDGKTVRMMRVMLEGREEIQKVEKVVGADGKEYPRKLENKSYPELTRERVEGPIRWSHVEVDEETGKAPPQEISFRGGRRGHARDEINRDHWSEDERALLDRFDAGKGIVVNMRKKGPHKNLVAWLRATDQLTVADRDTIWGNPFKEDEDGDRETVVRNHREHYSPHKPSLLNKLPNMKGTAWGCWCAPEPCHCDELLAKAEAS